MSSDKGLIDPFSRDDSLELDRLDHHADTGAHRYQIDPLDSSDGEDDDLDEIDEHHTLTGTVKKSHLDASTASAHGTSPLAHHLHGQGDEDTIDVHIIPLSSSEPIDRQRGDLQKNVTFLNGLSLVIGSIIGSGIFASPGPVLAYSKSVGVSLVVWFVSGLLAFAGSLCYAELGSAMPASGGGEHAYLNHAFGSLPAFLFSWSSISTLKVTLKAPLLLILLLLHANDLFLLGGAARRFASSFNRSPDPLLQPPLLLGPLTRYAPS